MNWERYNELIELRNSGHIEQSIAELTALGHAETDPAIKAVVLLEVAGEFRELKRFSDARLKIQEACAILGDGHEDYPRALSADAGMDIEERDWKGALKKLDWILEKRTELLQRDENKDVFEEVRRLRGIALSALWRFREARPLLESARLLEYDRVATLNSLGICDFELKDYDAAMEVFEEQLALDDSSSVFHAYANYYRGQILFQRGQLARAKSEFERCLACNDREEIDDYNLLRWLIETCSGFKLEEDVARYTQMLKNVAD